MSLEVLHRGPPWLPLAVFAAVAFLNASIVETVHSNGIGLTETFLTPAKEEIMFRLPVLLVGLFSKNPVVQIAAAGISSAAFAEYHDPANLDKALYYFVGGMALTGVAKVGGISNSYAAHAGINFSILTRAMGS